MPDGPLAADVRDAADGLVDSLLAGGFDAEAVATIGASEDARLGWFVSDLLRFVQGSDRQDSLVSAFQNLTGIDPRELPGFAASPWKSATDALIAWDLPAPPGYRELKGRIFVEVEPGWAPFFDDVDAALDWRHLSWGGVAIDDRPLGDGAPCPRGCIPALDDPALTVAAEGDWYPDERIVFGLVIGSDEVALPRNIMEIHEMVNMTVGGRRLGIPYCTLCGSAQAYLTDSVPDDIDVPVLRTSGLLVRSNKVMYDLVTRSVFDTFTGRARSGRSTIWPRVESGQTISWRARDGFEEVLLLAAQRGDEASREWTLWRLAHVELYTGDWPSAQRRLEEGRALADAGGRTQNLAVYEAVRALVEAHLGLDATARLSAQHALEPRQRTAPRVRSAVRVTRERRSLRVHARSGSHDEQNGSEDGRRDKRQSVEQRGRQGHVGRQSQGREQHGEGPLLDADTVWREGHREAEPGDREGRQDLDRSGGRRRVDRGDESEAKQEADRVERETEADPVPKNRNPLVAALPGKDRVQPPGKPQRGTGPQRGTAPRRCTRREDGDPGDGSEPHERNGHEQRTAPLDRERDEASGADDDEGHDAGESLDENRSSKAGATRSRIDRGDAEHIGADVGRRQRTERLGCVVQPDRAARVEADAAKAGRQPLPGERRDEVNGHETDHRGHGQRQVDARQAIADRRDIEPRHHDDEQSQPEPPSKRSPGPSAHALASPSAVPRPASTLDGVGSAATRPCSASQWRHFSAYGMGTIGMPARSAKRRLW